MRPVRFKQNIEVWKTETMSSESLQNALSSSGELYSRVIIPCGFNEKTFWLEMKGVVEKKLNVKYSALLPLNT